MGDIPFHLIYGVGDHLILQLTREVIFEGDYCVGGANHIDLINVRQHNNPNVLSGLHSFHRYEIHSIYSLKDTTDKHIKEQRGTVIIDLTTDAFVRLREMAVDFDYIQRVDNRYFKAVEQLSEADNIAIIPFGMRPSRCAQVGFLALCTWKQVFLFDMTHLACRKFYPELKEILESEYICKVVHKGGPLIDVLFCNYNVNVYNTFDTEVVDLIIQKRKTGSCPDTARTLSECLVEYFKLPPCFLKEAKENCAIPWKVRPLQDDQLIGAAQQVTCLIILKDQMEKNLLADVNNVIYKTHFSLIHMSQNNISGNVAEVVTALGQVHVGEKEPDGEE